MDKVGIGDGLVVCSGRITVDTTVKRGGRRKRIDNDCRNSNQDTAAILVLYKIEFMKAELVLILAVIFPILSQMMI